MFGKRGKKNGQQIGYETNSFNGCKMTITFSMSSQLWINIKMLPNLNKYKICFTTVSSKNEFNYIDLYEKFTSMKI